MGWLKMGNLLSYFSTGGAGGILLEVGDARLQAPEGDAEAADAVQAADEALERCKECMEFLVSYKPNDKLVQKALASPSDMQVRREAFQGMFGNVLAIKGFYELSGEMDRAVAALVRALLRKSAGAEALAEQPALAARLAALLEAVFLFDLAKMTQPAVQNDFSFYRRELSKNASTPGIPVDDTEASAISMFVAQGNPLLASLCASLSGLAKELPASTDFWAAYAAVACANVPRYSRKGDAPDPRAVQTLELSMVTAVAIYDRVDTVGAFSKSSPIDMKRVASSVKSWDGDHSGAALSTLQYATRTFSKAPSNVRKLFP